MAARLSHLLFGAALGALLLAASGAVSFKKAPPKPPRQAEEQQPASGSRASADRLSGVRDALERFRSTLAEAPDSVDPAGLFRDGAVQVALSSQAVLAVAYFQAEADRTQAETAAWANADGMVRIQMGSENFFLPLRFVSPGWNAPRSGFPFTREGRLPAAYAALEMAQEVFRATVAGGGRIVVSEPIGPNGGPAHEAHGASNAHPGVVWALAPLRPSAEPERLKGVVGALLDARLMLEAEAEAELLSPAKSIPFRR